MDQISTKPRVLVFASGGAVGGGSGFAKMVEKSRGDKPELDAEIVGVVSNHEHGGVRARADALGIPFYYFAPPCAGDDYPRIVEHFRADFVMLSGWLKKVSGLPMNRTVNIHPGPLPLTRGMHGVHVHETVLAAYHRGHIHKSAICIHFVDDEYDTGPMALTVEVNILPSDTPETLGARVNACEHDWQSRVLNQIAHGQIRLVGRTVERGGP